MNNQIINIPATTFTGLANRFKDLHPEGIKGAVDVLACLCKSDCGSYQDFCEDMGLPEYDEETGGTQYAFL